MLSAALDLVGTTTPKGVVLIADVLPSFIVKLVAPYLIDRVSYGVRVMSFAALSAGGMLLTSLTPQSLDRSSVSLKLLGVAFASLSSGGGELSFLGLTSFYGQSSLAAFSSGTGGAGIFGACLYALATITLRLTPRTTILASAAAPALMLWAYFSVLPSVKDLNVPATGYQSIPQYEDLESIQGRLSADHESGRSIVSNNVATSGTSKSATLQSLSTKFSSARKLIVPL